MMAAFKLDPHAMTLKQLLRDYVAIDCLPDIPVTGMSMDSRDIQPGNIFVALAGNREHGLAYAEAAVARGAVAVLCDRQFDQYCQQILSALMTQVVCVPVLNLKAHLGDIASAFYGRASSRLFTVGVTGTDGKTSVSHFIAQALHQPDQPVAVLGTIGNGLVDQLREASHTTADVIQVHRMIAEFEQQGARSLCMEVSSHGLDQGRVNAVDFDVAVLTNLGRDHLDYHGGIAEYRRAKQRLFQRPELKSVVLNLDDPFGRQLAGELPAGTDIWGYGRELADDCGVQHMVRATSVRVHGHGLGLHIVAPGGEADVEIPLLGEFNVANVLATLAVLLIKGIAFDDAIGRLQKLATVPGRMQVISVEREPLVVVDYAHTPQALASVLASLRKHCEAKLLCVFGCGGDRDRGKRPLMAQAAEQYADRVIVTDDNPRTEESAAIIQDIMAGFSDSDRVEVIADRRQAIAQAIREAGERDIVLIAGKGHESYQIIGRQKYPFSDSDIARACLEGNA